jgi:hypothetical protein
VRSSSSHPDLIIDRPQGIGAVRCALVGHRDRDNGIILNRLERVVHRRHFPRSERSRLCPHHLGGGLFARSPSRSAQRDVRGMQDQVERPDGDLAVPGDLLNPVARAVAVNDHLLRFDGDVLPRTARGCCCPPLTL